MRVLNIESALSDLSYSALCAWHEYYQVEPWGWEVEELRHGTLCSLVVNWSGKVAKEPVPPSDFFINSGTSQRSSSGPATLEEIEHKMGLSS